MARHGFPIIGSLLFVLLFLSPMILANREQLLELAKDVPDDKLHAALHNYDGGKFKHGIFPGDRPALEAVHRERAADAIELVLLAKRQSTTNTTQNTSVHTTSTTPLPPSTPTTPSTSPTSPTTTTHTTTAPTPTAPPGTDSTSTPTSTPTPPPASSQSPSTKSTTLRTTKTITGENGEPSTTTEVTVVVAQPTDDVPASDISPTPTPGPPKMQDNGVNGLKIRWIEAAGAAGAAALVFFML